MWSLILVSYLKIKRYLISYFLMHVDIKQIQYLYVYWNNALQRYCYHATLDTIVSYTYRVKRWTPKDLCSVKHKLLKTIIENEIIVTSYKKITLYARTHMHTNCERELPATACGNQLRPAMSDPPEDSNFNPKR